MAVLLMFTVSCKKDKKMEFENAGSGFRATVEKHDGDGKTYLDGTAVKWSENDAIAVKSGSCSEAKRFTTLATATRADFEAAEDLPADFYTPDYTAYYPAAAFSGDQLTLPATQTYEVGTFANGANPMAAYSDNTLLPFKNVCGLLEFQFYSATACTVSSVTLTTNKENESLWGKGTVSFVGELPSLGILTEGGNSLTLSCGDGIAMSTDENAPTTFMFVVPAGTLGESFSVTVTDSNGESWQKTAASSQNTIVRS